MQPECPANYDVMYCMMKSQLYSDALPACCEVWKQCRRIDVWLDHPVVCCTFCFTAACCMLCICVMFCIIISGCNENKSAHQH